MSFSLKKCFLFEQLFIIFAGKLLEADWPLYD